MKSADDVIKKPTRLAIGMEGGFDAGREKIEFEEKLVVVTMPELASVPWPCDQLPLQVWKFIELVTTIAMMSTGSRGCERSTLSIYSQQTGESSCLGWRKESYIQVKSTLYSH